MLEDRHGDVDTKVTEKINKVKGDTDPFIISGRMGPRHCGKIHYKINAISSLPLAISSSLSPSLLHFFLHILVEVEILFRKA